MATRDSPISRAEAMAEAAAWEEEMARAEQAWRDELAAIEEGRGGVPLPGGRPGKRRKYRGRAATGQGIPYPAGEPTRLSDIARYPGARGSINGYYVADYAGSRWVCAGGNPRSILDKSSRHGWTDWAAARDYNWGGWGPDDVRVQLVSAIWVKVEEGVPGPKRKRTGPAAKRSWGTLSPSTQRNYRNRMRHGLGIGRDGLVPKGATPRQRAAAKRYGGYRSAKAQERANAQFKDYYETAEDLRFLRRHEGPFIQIKGEPGRFSRLAREGTRFMTSWSQ